MPIDIQGREKIVSIENVIDFWIVEVRSGTIDKEVYPYSCVVFPHVCLTPVIAKEARP